MDTNITLQTKQMIDNLKAVCANKGLGNASSEYKIITEVFLYKFLNDKFLFEAKKADKSLAKLSSAEVEEKLKAAGFEICGVFGNTKFKRAAKSDSKMYFAARAKK